MSSFFRWLSFSLLLAALSASKLVAQPTNPEFDSLFAETLQQKLTQMGNAGDYRGLSAAVLVPGQGIWTGAYGLAAPGVPMATNMRLGIASNSKSITAGLLLKLQDEGLLDLDDPISLYLPDYPQVDGNIPIRALLNHSTGLFDFLNDWSTATQAAYGDDDDRAWTLNDLMATLGAPHFSLGERFDYSNTNFLVAGLVAEAAGGAPLGQLYHQYLFDPLGLDMAYPSYDDVFAQPYANLWNTSGTSVSLEGNGERTFLTFPASAGAIWSTPHDLVRWYDALFNSDWLGASSSEDLRHRDGYIAYTTGVRVRNDLGHSFYYHAGAWGFRSYLLYDPRTGISVSMISNQYGTSVSTAAVDLFAEVLAELPVPTRDVRLVDVVPVGTTCLASEPFIIIKNEGQETITSLEAGVGLDGIWQDTLTIALGTGLAPGAQSFVNLPFSLGDLDEGKKTLEIELITEIADDVPNNNYRKVAFAREDGTGLALPFTEDFEETADFPSLLISRQSDNLLDWTITSFAAATGEQSLARINYYDGNIGQQYAFDLPLLHIGAEGAMLSFAYAHAIYPGVGREDLRGYISTNCGANYELLFELNNNDLATSPQSTELFLPTQEQWATHQVDLSDFAGEDVLIRFELENEFGNLTYLDDITVDVATVLTELKAANIRLVPNPAQQQVGVYFSEKEQVRTCQVLDAYGRTLLTKRVAPFASEVIIERANLPAGIYFVKLFSDKGIVGTQRLLFF